MSPLRNSVKFILAGMAAGMVMAIPVPARAQVKNMGTPHIINYPKKVYKAASQSWSITQDQRGFMYFGNNDGVLEFDGKRWFLYSLPDRFLYRALCMGKEGTLYVGLSNDFGTLAPDERGKLTYRSISQKFPKTAFGFNDIWKIYETPEGIYFQSKNKIFLYHSDTLEIILPEKEFNFLYRVNKSLYTSERQLGLVQLNGTRTARAPGGELFAGMSIETMVPLDENRILIGTAKNGLYLYDGKTAVPWAREASDFLAENSIFCGTQIGKKYFAFGTIRNGVLIIDRNGRPIQHINQEKGLQNNTVLSMFADRDNNLWLGLDQGISYIELNSPVSYYSYGKALPGTGYCSIRTNGYMYAGTNQGLFAKKWTEYEDPLSSSDRFSLIPGTQGQVWSLRFIDNTLFCGHNAGTFLVDGTRAEPINDVPGGWDYLKLKSQPETIIEGTFTGIGIYARQNGKWRFDRPLVGFNESSRSFAEDDDGSIWVAHGSLGIFRVVTDKQLKNVTQVRVYNESDGLPSKYRNGLFKIDNQLLFTTTSGIYKYNKSNDSFLPDPVYANLLGREPVSSLFEDAEGNVWYFKPDEIGVVRTGSGGVKTVEKRPFNPIKKLTNRGFEFVNVVDETNIMIACELGFAHFDPSFPVKYPESRECYIRSVTGTGDSTVSYFGGVFTDHSGAAVSSQEAGSPIRIPYANNNIRIEFSLPLYENPEDLLFSYILEGYDRSRSEWSNADAKEYTGLGVGTYLFRVRGKSIYDIETPDTLIRIRILPPWYRSLLAYIFYVLVITGATGYALRRIIAKIRRDKQQITERHEQDILQAQKEHLADSLESEKKLVLLEKEKLQAEMEHKNKQLATSVNGLLKKNEFLIRLKEDLEKIAEKSGGTAAEERLRKLVTSVDENLEADNEYEQFEANFDAVHDNFLKNFKKAFPQLTPKDLRLCAYLRMNLSTKEIAPLLNITPRGVEISRYRLRKKMNLPHDANLFDFMLKF